MICKKCGSKLDNDSNFCPVCGSSIVPEQEKTEAKIQTADTKASSQSVVSKTYDSTKTNVAEEKKSDKESELYGSKSPKGHSVSKKIVALLLCLIAVICVYFVINNNGDSSDEKSGRGGSGSYTQNTTTTASTTEQHASATATEYQTTVTTEHHTSTSTTATTTTEQNTSATTTEQQTTVTATEQQTTATTEQQASAGTTTQTETEVSTAVSTEELANEADFNSYEAIAKLIGLQAKCEIKADACRCGLNYSKNPYDVDYDYGELYQKYVDACDWSLVFDADYYMEQFPYLALQYNYDEDWLLYHFQTIGIHEGRQGCADFNARVYLDSTCRDNGHIYETFDKNWECYYFYYMLNYDSQKSLETKSKDGIEAKFQYKTILTYNQAKELDQLNALRAENNLPALQINSELNAFANYRARIDFEEGNVAHAWAEKNTNYCLNMAKTVANTYDLNVITVIYAENKTMHHIGDTTTGYTNLLDSPDHVKQMLYDNISYTGLSNNFNGFNDFDTRGGYNKNVTINFEIFI